VCHSPELLAAYHGLHRLCVPRHPPHAFLRLTTYVAKQNYALTSQSTFYQFSSAFRDTNERQPDGTTAAQRDSVKIPFPTNQSSTKRPKVDDPSSVLHFSISVREHESSRGEPRIVMEAYRRCKCRRLHFPLRTDVRFAQQTSKYFRRREHASRSDPRSEKGPDNNNSRTAIQVCARDTSSTPARELFTREHAV
jgi:hypothetical protein